MSAADQEVRATDSLRVRLLQTEPRLGDVAGNLARLDLLVSERPQADLVVAPELATHGYHLGELGDPAPLAGDDARLAALGGHGPTVVTGFVEQSRHHVHNSAAIVDADGVRVQRKLFLPTYGAWEERKHFRPGARTAVHHVGGAEISVLICNDMWQPVLPWLAAHAGAEVLVVPVNSVVSEVGSPTDQTWDLILRHAAITLQAYVVFVNRTGREGGATFWGGSRVISPQGTTLVELDDQPGTAEVDLDLAGLRTLRRRWPLLQESRFDLVAAEAARLHAEDA